MRVGPTPIICHTPRSDIKSRTSPLRACYATRLTANSHIIHFTSVSASALALLHYGQLSALFGQTKRHGWQALEFWCGILLAIYQASASMRGAIVFIGLFIWLPTATWEVGSSIALFEHCAHAWHR